MPIPIKDLMQRAQQNQAPAAQPQMGAKPTFSASTMGEVIGQYNEHGHNLRGGPTMMELAERLMQIAEFAENVIMSEADDWFDGHTIQRNMKEMKGYVKEFSKVAKEHDLLKQRATALYDDMGRVLERYFEIQDDAEGEERTDQQYDTDGDGLPDTAPINSPKDGVDTTHAMKSMTDEGTPEADTTVPDPSIAQAQQQDSDEHNKDLIERLLRLARHKLTGEQLVRFDTLKKETQIRAAWRIVR